MNEEFSRAPEAEFLLNKLAAVSLLLGLEWAVT